jgi:hypothetical protein
LSTTDLDAAASTLLQKLTLAIPQAVIHHWAFLAFSESLQVNHTKEMVNWENQVIAWEHDHDAYCPYNIPDQSECLFYHNTVLA